MLLRRKERPSAEINVGPFSDNAFLLIIFFILTTTLVKPAFEKLDIPSGTANPDEKNQKQFSILLKPSEIRHGEKAQLVSGVAAADGDFGKQVDALRALLDKEKFLAKEEKDRIVVLESTDDVPYEEYYKVVMAITESGGVLALVEPSAEKGE